MGPSSCLTGQDRQDRTDRQTDKKRSDSIGRTVLQTVAQKKFALCYGTVVLSVCPVLSCDVGVLWPNGRTDQDKTWHAGKPRPWPYCIRWGPSSPPILAHICCGQMAAGIKMPLDIEVGLIPEDFMLDGDPAPPQKGGRSPLPNFRPMSIAAKRLDGSRRHLIRR